MVNVFIDISNNFHKSFFIVSAYKDFDITEEKWQRILIRKFITDLFAIVKKFDKIEILIFCFDAENNYRKELSQEYKAHRGKKADVFYDLLNDSYTLLQNYGFNCLKIEGLEADDLLALCNEYYANKINILVSNDEDIRQLVSNKTMVFTANTNNFKLFYNGSKFSTDYINLILKNFTNSKTIVDPELIKLSKLLLGCSGDNVKRLLPKGVGDKKVEQIYNKYKETNNLQNVLIEFGYPVSEFDIYVQEKLVILNHNNMPQLLYYRFLDLIKFMNNGVPTILMADIVKNTNYEFE